jgi:DNA adenine methylase
MRNGSGIVGSKAVMGAAQRIVSEMPAHELYIEAFAGSAAVGRLKKRCELEVYIERDPYTAAALHQTMPDRQIVIGDCTQILVPESVHSEAVLYADPPYLMSTRSSKRKYYRYELSSDAGHARLLEWLLRFRCRVLLSGYWSELYLALLPGWRMVQFGVVTRGGRALECLWMNFPPTENLHDTRFVGTDFRDRERIKRKASRWARRIQAMPAAERAAVLSALVAPDEPSSAPAGSLYPVIQASRICADDKVPQLKLL